MLTLTLALTLNTLASAELPQPPMVEATPAPSAVAPRGKGRSARLLDAETQAQLKLLDERIAALQATPGQKALTGVAIGGLAVVATPIIAAAVGVVVGMVVGAASYGLLGFFAGMFVGGWAVLAFIPPVAWALIAVAGVVGLGAFVVERVSSAERREQLQRLKVERRNLLRGAPRAELSNQEPSLLTVGSF